MKYLLIAGLLIVLGLGFRQWLTLRQAHSSFENYYAFRGCIKLISKTDTEGVCKTNSGQTIKIVKFHNKWYLDKDLPWACLGSICVGI